MTYVNHPNLITRTEEMVHLAVVEHRADTEVYFAVSVNIVPDQVPDTFVPILVITLAMPDSTFTNLISFDLLPDPATVNRQVATALAEMRASQSTATV